MKAPPSIDSMSLLTHFLLHPRPSLLLSSSSDFQKRNELGKVAYSSQHGAW